MGLLSSSSTSSFRTRPVRGKIQTLCHIQWPKQTKSHSVLVLHICRDIMKHKPTHWVVHRGMSVCTFTLICSCTCKHHECTLWFGSYDTPLSHQLLCCMFDAAVRPLWFSASGLTTGRANEVHSNLLYWFLSVWRTRNFFFNFFIFRDPRANSGTLLIVCTTVVVQHVLNVWCVIQYMFVCLHAWSQCYEYSLCVWGAHKPAFLKVWGAETWQVGRECTR